MFTKFLMTLGFALAGGFLSVGVVQAGAEYTAAVPATSGSNGNGALVVLLILGGLMLLNGSPRDTTRAAQPLNGEALDQNDESDVIMKF